MCLSGGSHFLIQVILFSLSPIFSTTPTPWKKIMENKDEWEGKAMFLSSAPGYLKTHLKPFLGNKCVACLADKQPPVSWSQLSEFFWYVCLKLCREDRSAVITLSWESDLGPVVCNLGQLILSFVAEQQLTQWVPYLGTLYAIALFNNNYEEFIGTKVLHSRSSM